MLTRKKCREIAAKAGQDSDIIEYWIVTIADALFAAFEAERAERDVALQAWIDTATRTQTILDRYRAEAISKAVDGDLVASKPVDARAQFEERVHAMACALAGTGNELALETSIEAIEYVRAVDAALAKERGS